MSKKNKRIARYQVEGQSERETSQQHNGPTTPLFKGHIEDITEVRVDFAEEWKDVLKFLPIAFAMLVVYVLTLARTVPGGDSGELISVAYNLGVAHPPGYPLYTLLGHLFTYIPYGSIAWRVNFFSAVTTVGTAIMVFMVVNRWLRNYWAAAFASVLFCMSPLTWRYAVVAEVFALSNFFITWLLYITLRFYEDPKEKWAFWWAGVLGLACSHHHTVVLIAIPIFVMCLIKAARVLLTFRVISISLMLFLAGFLPYLYLPWASTKRLMLSWGELDNWDGFWLHFLRGEYGTFQLATGEKTNYFFRNMKTYFFELGHQFMYVCLIPLVMGVYLQVMKKGNRWKDYGWMLLMACLAYLVVFHNLANMDITNRLFYDVQSRFWMLPNLIMSCLAAAGLIWIQRHWFEAKNVVPAISIVLGLAQIGVHYEMEDMSKNDVFYQMGKSTLEPLPKNALYLMRGDVYVNAVRYLQDCENYRKDVAAIPFDLLWWPWMKKVVETNFKDVVIPGKVYRYQVRRSGDFVLSDLVAANIERRDVFIGKLRDDEAALMDPSYNLWNIGYINKVLPKNKDYVFNDFVADSKPFETQRVPQNDQIREKSWEAFIFYNFWDREIDRSRQIFSHAMKLGVDTRWIRYGADILERVVKDYPNPPAHTYRNLGVAYQFLAKTDPRYVAQMVAVWERYLSMNPQGDHEIEGIKALVAQNRAALQAAQAAQMQQQNAAQPANQAPPPAQPSDSTDRPPAAESVEQSKGPKPASVK